MFRRLLSLLLLSVLSQYVCAKDVTPSEIGLRSMDGVSPVYSVDRLYDLRGNTLILPNGSTIVFSEIGQLQNGALTGNNTCIQAPIGLRFSNVICTGTFLVEKILPQWFGAKADGKNDDTRAVQAALDMQSKTVRSISNTESKAATFSAAISPVYFPAGVYNISDINIYIYVNIEGDHSVIRSDGESFVFHPKDNSDRAFAGWRGRIVGMVFNAKKCISLNTRFGKGEVNNLDQGKLEIVDCEFKNCDVPIYADVQSSLFLIHNCVFDRIGKLDIVACDGFRFYNNWVYPKENSVENYGSFIKLSTFGADIYDNVFVPSPQKNVVEHAWVSLNGSGEMRIDIHNNRFGGENGSCTVLNNKCEKSIISIFHNQMYSVAGGKESCGVRLFALPLQLEVAHNNGLLNTNYIVYLSNKEKSDEKLLFNGYERCKYKIEDNQFALYQHGSIVNKYRFLFTRKNNDYLTLNQDDITFFSKKDAKGGKGIEIPMMLISSPATTTNQEGTDFINAWECNAIIGIKNKPHRQIESFIVYTQEDVINGNISLTLKTTNNISPLSKGKTGISKVMMKTDNNEVETFRYGQVRSASYPVKALSFYLSDKDAYLISLTIKRCNPSYNLYQDNN